MLPSRHFGSVVPDNDLYVAGVLRRGEEAVRIDLNVERATSLDRAALDAVDATLDELDALDRAARVAIEADKNATDYWEFHRDEVEGYGHLARTDLIAALQLVRVGFYPDGAHGARNYVTFDYKLRGPVTDQLLVVMLMKDRTVLDVAWES